MEDKNFEKYFRQQFQKNIPSDTWNTPSDAVWDNIEQQMGHQKSRKGLLFFLILGSFLLLGSLGILLWTYHQNKILIQQLQEELRDCQVYSATSGPETEKIVLPSDNQNAVNFIPDISKYEFSEKNIEPSHSFSRLKSVKTENLESQFSIPQENTIASVLIPDKNKEFESEYIHSLRNSLENYRDITQYTYLIPLLYPEPLTSQKKNLLFPKIAHVHSFDRSRDFSDKRIELGLTSGLLTWQNRSRGDIDNALNEIMIHERISPSASIGAFFEYHLNDKWSIGSGLNYFSREMTTIYHVDLEYDSRNEMLNGDEYENTFEHSLPTGWGNVNTTLVLSRVLSSPLSGNSFVPVDMSIRHRVHSAEVPIVFHYSPNGKEKGPFFRAGIHTEWIWREGSTHMTSQSHHSIIKEKDAHSSFDTKQINNWLVSATLGAGWKMNLKNNVGLRVLAEYGLGLNPMVRIDSYALNLDRAGVSLAMFYRFGGQ